MSITLHRQGSGIGLEVPQPLLDQLGLAEGSQVEIKVEGDRLVVEPTRRARMTMAELLEGFTPDDQPGELDWGQPAGREAW
jgi:antitoxin MazE